MALARMGAQVRLLFRSVAARNAASSFVALGWLSLLSFLTIPLYIGLLGVAEWGLVAACASLQVLSNFLDSGFSQIVPRLAAQEAHNESLLHQTVRLLRRVYFSLGLLMFLVIQGFAGYLSHEWFRVPAEQINELEVAIRICSFQLLFQFVNNLHIGLWLGLQHQVLANLRNCGFGTLKHIVALSSLFLISPQVWVYVSSFALVALLEVGFNALTIRAMLASPGLAVKNGEVKLGPLLNEVIILSGGILVGLLVSQLDRIILSRTVSAEYFGIYTVVATLALAFLQLQAPLTRAYFPVLVKAHRISGLLPSLHLKKLLIGTLLMSTLPSIIACVFAPQLLTMWLNNSEIVTLGTTTLRLILLAIALNSIYNCIYQVMVASGSARLVLQLNMACLIVILIVALSVGGKLGIELGGFIWVAASLTQLILGSIWIFKSLRASQQALLR